MKKAVGLVIAAVLALTGQSAFAQTFPKLTGRVVDQADLLDPQSESTLTSKLATSEHLFGPQFVIVTIKSLGGKSIEDFGLHLGNLWGIGDEQRDDGIILLVAPNERRVRIEVGYGMESTFPDKICQEIIDEVILPRFRAGNIQQGIVDGADRILDRVEAAASKMPNDNDNISNAKVAA